MPGATADTTQSIGQFIQSKAPTTSVAMPTAPSMFSPENVRAQLELERLRLQPTPEPPPEEPVAGFAQGGLVGDDINRMLQNQRNAIQRESQSRQMLTNLGAPPVKKFSDGGPAGSSSGVRRLKMSGYQAGGDVSPAMMTPEQLDEFNRNLQRELDEENRRFEKSGGPEFYSAIRPAMEDINERVKQTLELYRMGRATEADVQKLLPSLSEYEIASQFGRTDTGGYRSRDIDAPSRDRLREFIEIQKPTIDANRPDMFPYDPRGPKAQGRVLEMSKGGDVTDEMFVGTTPSEESQQTTGEYIKGLYKENIPVHARVYLETLLGKKDPITAEDFTKEELADIEKLLSSKPAKGAVTEYSDYEKVRDLDREGRHSSDWLENLPSVGKTLGRFTYETLPDGRRVIKDTYDFYNTSRSINVQEFEEMGPAEKALAVFKKITANRSMMDPPFVKRAADVLGEAYIGRDGRPVKVEYDPKDLPVKRQDGSPVEGEMADDMFLGTRPEDFPETSPVDTAVSDFISSRSKLVTDPQEFFRVMGENIKQQYGDINNDPKAMEAFLMDNLGFGGLTAYHASGKMFKQLDPSKAKSGIGEQRYGTGAGYTAESRPVAESFMGAEAQALRASGALDPKLEFVYDLVSQKRSDMDVLDAIAAKYGKKIGFDEAQDILKKAKSMTQGYLYKGDIPDEIIPSFLDWNKSLKQQTAEVKKLLSKDPLVKESVDPANWREVSGGIIQKGEGGLDDLTGDSIYKYISLKLGSDSAATDYLDKLGVRGIRYADPGSKGLGREPSGTSNFVVFRPEDYRIESVNDVPVKRQEGSPSVGEISNDEFIQQMMTGTRPTDETTSPGILPPEIRQAVDVPLDFANLLIRGTAAVPIGGVAGLYKGITGGKYGTQEGVKEADTEAARMMAKITGEPKTQAAKDVLEFIGGKAQEYKLDAALPQLLTLPSPGPGAASALMRSYELAETPPSGVVKMPGGNWLKGQVESFVRPLKKDIPWTQDQLEEMPGVAKAEAPNLALNKFIETGLTRYIKNDMASAKDTLRNLADENTIKAGKAYNNDLRQVKKAYDRAEKIKAEGPRPNMLPGTWENAIEAQLGRARQLEEEANRKLNLELRHALPFPVLQEDGELAGGLNFHMRRNLQTGGKETLVSSRKEAGQAEEGVAQTPTGKVWETMADLFVKPQAAGQITDQDYFMRSTDSQRVLRNNPWLATVPPETPVYIPQDVFRSSSFLNSFSADDLGFKHITDELANAMNPESGLPANLLLTPDEVANMGMEKAARHVIEVNKWREEQMGVANALRAQKSISLYKDYPTIPGKTEPNQRGLQWLELKLMPEDDTPESMVKAKEALADALKYEGEVMGHCVGGECPKVESGKSRIISLRDAKGEPHVTLEVIPPEVNFSDVLGGNPAFPNRDPELYRMMDTMTTTQIEKTPLYKEKAAAIAAQKLPGISQIKGKGNNRPPDSYQPFITDFIASQQWSSVGDLQNTNLVRIEPRILKNAQDRGFNPQIVTTIKERPYITKEEFNRLADLFGGMNKYAAGGEVTDFIKRAA
jgi:hypothetical protein